MLMQENIMAGAKYVTINSKDKERVPCKNTPAPETCVMKVNFFLVEFSLLSKKFFLKDKGFVETVW